MEIIGVAGASGENAARPARPQTTRMNRDLLELAPVRGARPVRARFTNRFDGLGAGLRDEDDGAAFVAEGGAHLAGQVFAVGVGEQIIAVDKQEEGRWR